MNQLMLIFVCGVVLLAGNAFGQLEVGDSCVDEESGRGGICKLYNSCQAARDKWEIFGKKPSICGSRDTSVIVCCPKPRKRPTPTRRRRPTITKRISELKCKEYSKPVTRNEQRVPLSAGAAPVNVTFAKCAYEKNTLIVGGNQSIPGEFPHMAALGWEVITGYAFKCGGSLISDKYVLTAAHCTSVSSRDTESIKSEPTIVRLGDHDLRPDVKDGAKPVNVNIKIIIKHPNFTIGYNDIALLELDEVVQFNSFVRPACLWQKQHFEQMTTGIVTGWGAIEYKREQSDVLLKASIDLLPNEECDPLLYHVRNRHWKGFNESQMCAGDLMGKHDTCQGDSGSPLVLTKPENNCIFYITGITSRGFQCAQKNEPGIYTRVSSYVPWIESIVWPN